MKKMKLSVPVLALFLFSAYTGSSQNKMAANHQMQEGNMNQKKEMMNNEMAKSQTIKLKKGELFLVISSITKPGAQNQMNDYFQTVFPIASKNGFTPLASLPIDKVIAGNYKPNNFVGLYTWPSMDAVQSFLKELPNSELTPMRKKIWNELKQVIVGIKIDFEFTLHENKVYEIQTIWNDMSIDESKDKMLVEKYNGKVVLNFPVVGYEDLNSGKTPTQTVLIEWESEKDANTYRMKKKSSHKEESFLIHLQMPAN